MAHSSVDAECAIDVSHEIAYMSITESFIKVVLLCDDLAIGADFCVILVMDRTSEYMLEYLCGKEAQGT